MDLISRKAAIRWIKTECNPYGAPTIEYQSGVRVIEHLEKMPPAQPEQKTGKWIRWVETEEDRWGVKYVPHCKCSKCDMEYDPYFARVVKYCYRCGAKMEGEHE